MHPAWQNLDISLLIFEHLNPRSLARIARTCKALFHVATDELWKTLDSVLPFLSCLHPDFRNRRLQDKDVKSLDFYAAKVRNLLLESQTVLRLPRQFRPRKSQTQESWEEIWKEIANLRQLQRQRQLTSDFLPNLRHLRVNNVEEEFLIPLIGMSGSNLTQIYIKSLHERQSKSIVFQMLDQLQSTAKLEYLFVRDGEPDLVPSQVIRDAPLKHLRLDPRIHGHRHEEFNFKQFPLRQEILQKSSLENLTLGLTRQWCTPEIKASKEKYLPALKSLWLNLTTFKPERCDMSCVNMTSHSWTCYGPGTDNTTDCGRRPPTRFLEGLDNPELSILIIKFPIEATGRMFLDVVSAANKSCRLGSLTELALAGGGYFNNCPECRIHPGSDIKPTELREALKMLLPMPKLKTLRLSVAPNFLDVLDLQLYESITSGLPALEKLYLGHREFTTSSEFHGTVYREAVPVYHLAAFCSMLPSLVEVGVGTVDTLTLEESPRTEWACPSVRSLRIGHYAYPTVTSESRVALQNLLLLSFRAYFPNSDRAQ